MDIEQIRGGSARNGRLNPSGSFRSHDGVPREDRHVPAQHRHLAG